MARLRSSLAAPGGARLLGGIVALAGVALLIAGVVALGGDDGDSGAAPGALPTVTAPPGGSSPGTGPTGAGSVSAEPTTVPSTVSTSTLPAPTSSVPVPPATTPAPTTTPAGAARAPLTVLNNSTVAGLGDRAAADAQRRGWQVAQVGNFAGRLPVSTVYYTPGDAAGERAARALAAEFPQIGRVFPRYAGLPPTPAGIVLVVTRDWS